jgi:MFS family permease
MLKNFLSNRGINMLNIHIGIAGFANNFGSIFIAIFLYQNGISIPYIFLGYAIGFFARLVLRPIALKFCLKYGLKKVLIIGTLFYAANYPILGQVEGVDIWFYGFFLLFAITDVFYWLPYHSIFTIIGDDEHRGKQTSIRDGVYMFGEFLAPIISGIMILKFGYQSAFYVAMLLMFLAIPPILKIENLDIKKLQKKNKKPISKKGFWLYAGYGFAMNNELIWTILLFLIVLNPAYFGGLIGLAVLIQIIINMFIGHKFDTGKGKRIYQLGSLLIAVSIIIRGIWVDTISEVIMSDIIIVLGYLFFDNIFNSAFYNISSKSQNPLNFQYFAEMGWDIGAGLAALMTATLTYYGYSLQVAMIISVLGFFMTNQVLCGYFEK